MVQECLKYYPNGHKYYKGVPKAKQGAYYSTTVPHSWPKSKEYTHVATLILN